MSGQQPSQPIPTTFPLVGLLLDRQSGTVAERREFMVLHGRAFKAGRSPDVCELAVPRDQSVSAVAAALKYTIIMPKSSTDGAQRPPFPLVQLWCRQGGSGSLTVEGGGDSMTIRRGGPPLSLRLDTRYQVSLFTPAPVLRLEFHTPAPGAPPDPEAGTGTLSVTMSGPAGANEPSWTRVVLLAVLIERFPDVIPVRAGAKVSPSKALVMLGELFCGQSRPEWYSQQLDAALRSVEIVVAKGGDRQGRVATHFGQRADTSKLAIWRDRVVELGILDE